MKTAVEWLYEELKENNLHTFNEWKEIFKQAKEMEKQQIINAFVQGDLFSEDYLDAKNPTNDCAENYYNETFGETIVTEYRDGTIDVETFKKE